MLVPVLCLSLWCLAVSAHEYYSGRCPQFVPMASLDWQSFTGDWWVVFKMSSRSSCIRYNFATSGGERIVTEEKLLPVLGRWVERGASEIPIHNSYMYIIPTYNRYTMVKMKSCFIVSQGT